MSEISDRKLEAIRTQWCKHFTGIMNKACNLGINYESVRDDSKSPYTFACIDKGKNCSKYCDKREFYTLEETRDREERREKRITEYLKNITENICPICKIKVTPIQVSSCVYAQECGHRLYQGKVSAAI